MTGQLISLAHMNLLDLAPPEVVRVAGETGFASVGLRLSPARPEESVPPVYGDTPMRRGLEANMRHFGVSVLDIELVWLREDEDVSRYGALIELGHRLGARNVLVCCDMQDHGAAAAQFAALCEIARPSGMNVNLEFLPWCSVGRLDDALAIVTEAAQPNGKLLLDPLHLSRSGGSVAELKNVAPGLLSYAQICDARAELPVSREAIIHEAKFDRLVPGQGELNLAGFCHALPADIPLSVEVAFASELGLSPRERAERALKGTQAFLGGLGPDVFE